MTVLFKNTILEEAISWIESGQQVALVTVVETWGSSPFQIGSKMIINEKGNFLGSVSGGCVETSVITECLELIKNKNSFKKIKFKVKNLGSFEKIKMNGVKFSKSDSEITAVYDKKKFRFDEIINVVKENAQIIDISTDDGDLEDIFVELTNN